LVTPEKNCFGLSVQGLWGMLAARDSVGSVVAEAVSNGIQAAGSAIGAASSFVGVAIQGLMHRFW
jgi:hypothetical protein